LDVKNGTLIDKTVVLIEGGLAGSVGSIEVAKFADIIDSYPTFTYLQQRT